MAYFYEDAQKCEIFCDGMASFISTQFSICTPDEGITNSREQAKSVSRTKGASNSIAVV